jgi:hypothetical protein
LPNKDLEARRNNNSKCSSKKYAQKKKEQSRKSRKRAVKRNRRYVDAYKIKNPCPCGTIEPCCLSFHHVNDDKTGNISDMVNRGYGIPRIQKEIDKCIVLCLNCHAKLHNKEKLENNEKKRIEASKKALELVESKI